MNYSIDNTIEWTIICTIPGGKLSGLTKGKKYKVIAISNALYMIRDDYGSLSNYLPERFITLSEYRQSNLEKIGI